MQIDEITTTSSPILVKQTSKTINGILTQVLTQSFSDRIFVLVTQLGKVGTLTEISIPMTSIDEPYEVSPAIPEINLPSLPEPHTSLQLVPLLSTPPSELKTIYEVYLNQIGMLVFTGFGPKPNPPLDLSQTFRLGERKLIVGLALDSRSQPKQVHQSLEMSQVEVAKERICFGSVMEMIMECRVW